MSVPFIYLIACLFLTYLVSKRDFQAANKDIQKISQKIIYFFILKTYLRFNF